MELADAVARSQQVLGGIFDKPRLSQTNLAKPKFLFIHRVVTSILQETGFPANYFDADELDSAIASRDKESKQSFLNKLHQLVNLSRPKEIDVRVSKIIEGKEPEKTNALLMEFGVAATDEALHRDKVIRQCLEGAALESKTANKASKQAQSFDLTPTDVEPSKHPTDNTSTTPPQTMNDGAPRIDQLHRAIIDGPQSPSTLAVIIGECDTDIGRAKKALQSILGSKSIITEESLTRPSNRFLHDVVMSICKTRGYCQDGVFSAAEQTYSSLVDKQTKLNFFHKIIHEVHMTLDMTMDVRASKVIAGKECDKTMKFLQLLVLAAKQDGTIAAILDEEEANEEKGATEAMRDHAPTPRMKNPDETQNMSGIASTIPEETNQVGSTTLTEAEPSSGGQEELLPSESPSAKAASMEVNIVALPYRGASGKISPAQRALATDAKGEVNTNGRATQNEVAQRISDAQVETSGFDGATKKVGTPEPDQSLAGNSPNGKHPINDVVSAKSGALPNAVRDSALRHAEHVQKGESAKAEMPASAGTPDSSASSAGDTREKRTEIDNAKGSPTRLTEKNKTAKSPNGEIRMQFAFSGIGAGSIAKDQNPAEGSSPEDLQQAVKHIIKTVEYLGSLEDVEDDLADMARERDYWKCQYQMQQTRWKEEQEQTRVFLASGMKEFQKM
jgi:hypothetical protein